MNPFQLNPLWAIAGSAILLGIGGLGGWKLRDADYQRHLKEDALAQAKSQEDARALEGSLEGKAQEVREDAAQERYRTQVVYRTITKEVPVNVTQTHFASVVDTGGALPGGGLPAGLVWSFNSAASNTAPPLPSGLDPDTPSGVSLSTLAETTAWNFSLYHQCRTDLEAWSKWYSQLVATWPSSATKKEAE